ncbi:hypothetical protein EC973_008530 [Apophysomyces ossiformis]|uniref:Peptidase M16 C-terminal domain-containing protein n=1 Tax=Apophysomyces ossiformis TaxID=679940 RepID=A0A8H7BNE9_9FUNG|nr:hypothetical protein EC973_008530 [Apophysomyces ossiformis]
MDPPLVNGYFTLATEALSRIEQPLTILDAHTPWNIWCFWEASNFRTRFAPPDMGVLDSLANRAVAQGTNAWTDVDHTCYTITTAGSQGFLKLLPIYVDHILYPTLTDSGYHTEVVYSEMQGYQNVGDDRIRLRMKRLMYPSNCGYRSETGGLMECLRELSVETIRSYHKNYYRPDNLCLIVTGKVDHNDLMEALAPVEQNIISKGALPKMQRPWIETGNFPNLDKNIEETVLFADEDESMGTVLIAWNGPMCHEYLLLKALEVLEMYLTDSPVSVLQKEFVEIEDPLCTDVDFQATDHLKATLVFLASNVPFEEIENFPSHFFATLQRLVTEEDFDMQRMATVIEKESLRLLDNAETDAHGTAAAVCISDFLYGTTDGQNLEDSVKDQEYLDQLSRYTKWYLEPPHLTLLGKPSAAFAEKLVKEERERIDKQRADLGETRLAELQQKLEEAMAANDVALPKEVLENFKIPPVSSINFINVISARNNGNGEVAYVAILEMDSEGSTYIIFSSEENVVQRYIDKDEKADIPLFIQFDSIKSQFVKISIHVSTSSIPSHLLPYTRLFLKSIFSLPVERDGQIVSYEDVVKGLGEDTVEYEATLGTSCGFRELVVFSLKAKTAKYERAIQWLKDIMWNTQFSIERLKIVAYQIINDIPQAKRDAHSMLNACMRAFQYDTSKSVTAARNVLFQASFLQTVLQKLDDEPSAVLADLNAFRNACKLEDDWQVLVTHNVPVCQPQNIRVHVSGDILKLESPRNAFRNFCSIKSKEPLAPVTLSQEVLSPAGKEPGQIGVIVNMPAIENSCSLHTVKGPNRFDDPDIGPLLVMIEILDTMEGIFWKFIRGQGLAYSCYLEADVEAGMINYMIFQSPDVSKAIQQAKHVINQLANDEIKIEPSAVDGAKSSVIYTMVAQEDTMERAALQSFVNQVLKQMPASYNKDLLASIQATTMEDLRRVLKKYFFNLFDPSASNVVVVSSPAKISDIHQGLENLGFSTKSISFNDVSSNAS